MAERMVPRNLTAADRAAALHDPPCECQETARVVARELDVREFRARTAIEAALAQLEERGQLVEPGAPDFRRQAAALRQAARTLTDSAVELASIAGEYDGQARGL